MTPGKVDELAGMLADIETEEYKLKQRKQLLGEQILELIDDPPKKGTVPLEGSEFCIAVEFKESASYRDKEALEEWVLSASESEPLFRIDYKERTAVVERFLDENEGQDSRCGTEARHLKELRTVKPGKPSIKLRRMK